MSRRWLLSLSLCLGVLFLLSVEFTRARGELRVDEAGSKILLEKNPAEVLLAVQNPSLASVNANVHIELLDPRDNSIAKTTQVKSIAHGAQTVKLSLPYAFPSSDERERNRILLYRLRYRLTPQDSPEETLADGIISMSEMTPDIFELRVSTAGIVREGNGYRVRVQAVHPITNNPAPNVDIDAQVTLDGDSSNIIKLDRSRLTDANGRAVLDFELPRRFPHQTRPSGGELKVTGTKGAIVVQTKGEVRVDQFPRILINTDKPLYQPGQVMHMRALLLAPSRRALANLEPFFKITDPEGAVLYRTAVTSSRFGIASADWTIPENTRLGNYRILVSVDGGDEQEVSQQVRISRYELPNFRINVDIDRKFYLPGQDATVTVRADYLFGQPVMRGNVRVVRESEREWNYREQKWELREEAEQKGETSANGSFVAKLDLSSYHDDLTGSDDYRFRDVTFAAYFTDPTTNRTEQRRFDVRVTKDPIHVYIVETYDYSYSRELPVKFYVSTFYPDGAPARCKLNVTFTDDYDSEIKKRVATITTNRYGLGQISTPLPKQFKEESYIDVVLSATDSQGRKASHTEEFRLDSDPRVRIETDKTIYRPGEPIAVVITGTDREGPVIVNLAGETGVIRSERVQLRGGRGLISFPYRSEFKNYVSLVAYPESTQSRNTVATRTVVYPYNTELDIKLQSSRDTYRPGEDAQLNFNVSSSRDRSPESALGVVVLDQAVVERFRTDEEFGGRNYGMSNAIQRFLGLEDQVAGVSLRDLQRLHPSRPVSPELDMLAAVLLINTSNYMPEFYASDEFEQDAARVFGDPMREQLKPVKTTLWDHHMSTNEYPSDETKLHSSLARLKIDFDKVRDPWGMPYHATFILDKQLETLRFMSSGADKRYNTADDFIVDSIAWPYFRVIGEKIDGAMTRYHQRTGKFIRDTATLREELSPDGVNLNQIADRWGQPYRLDFAIQGNLFVLKIRSSGPDKQFSPYEHYAVDDFVVWQSTIDYFAEPRAQIGTALTENFNKTKTFPQSERELDQALQSLGDAYKNLRDPWGRPYYSTFSLQSVFTDRVRLENHTQSGETPSLKTNVTPVTQTLGHVVMRSVGADASAGTVDDFPVATFTVVVSEQPRGAPAPVVLNSGIVLSGLNGAIVGVVTDPAGATIAGVTVKAMRVPAGPTTETSSNEEGKYSFSSLAPGSYELTFDAPGFMRNVITQVVVRPQNIMEVNVTMQVGTAAETVTVTAEAPLNMTDTSISINGSRSMDLPVVRPRSARQQISTPRLREYFPETLLWQPSIETDKQGRAQINFKLADNITTWKVMVIGSTEDGRIGTTEKEIKAFQPFFVEHDPPRVLTEGDEISLPVVIRNYLSQPQKVGLEIKPETWFSLLGPAQKQTSVVAGDATRETFDFRVVSSVKDGKQRITARGSDEQDAIEKPVSVHPDGEELSVTAGDLLNAASSLELEIGEAMVPNSGRAELKIYPNLLAHVVEGVEGIMHRPYGCGEQTISSTYPSLLLLRHHKKTGQPFPLSARAQRYLRDGYSRLLNYRAENGGFTYWVYGEPDAALTAYALQFLIAASDLVDVDANVIAQARESLVKQQQPDGSWRQKYWWAPDDPGPSVVLTAYITRVLARTDAQVSDPVKRALDFLERESQRMDEPYLLASYGLAAIDAKDTARAKSAVAKLRTLAREEGNTSYWALETNTPFYGWGLAGRIETTALVVQALAKDCNSQTAGCDVNRKLIDRGLLFLLKQKDRYGVWYSTQATVNVLDMMLVLFSTNGPVNAGSQSTADLVVNGNRMQTVQLDYRLNNPVTVDISQFLKAGKNVVEIKRPAGLPHASVQAVANYYVPWSAAKPSQNHATSDLRLQVKFDKTEAKINEDVTCRVEAERVGFRGYGMMLAEIGIPPGAEVDRSSLEKASKDWTISRYDVLPDRVVVYLWPKAGAISFDFKFRPRFGLKAKSAASTLYDYYNPEATVVVAPSLFTVR